MCTRDLLFAAYSLDNNPFVGTLEAEGSAMYCNPSAKAN